MENTYKEATALLATIEHLMVANGLLEFKANDELQPIVSEELINYLAIKDQENPDLCTIDDKVTEMKIATCILRYLHKNQPDNSKEYNEQICQGALTTMRVLKLQLWYGEGQINEAQYDKLLRIQKRAEILAEAKYRVKTTLAGAGVGAVIGVAVLSELKKFGLVVEPQTASIIIAIGAALGVLLGLFLPKDKIAQLKKWAEHEILPLLKDSLNKKVEDLKIKLPQEFSSIFDTWIDKFKEIIVGHFTASGAEKEDEEEERELEDEVEKENNR